MDDNSSVSEMKKKGMFLQSERFTSGPIILEQKEN